MIGTLNSQKKEAFIIGAGISGLLIGYRLKQLGYQIQIHERSNHVGGLIQTKQTPFGPVEAAAHSLLISPPLAKFFSELNVPLQTVNQNSRARYIVRNGKMRRMPLRPLEILTTLKNFFSKPSNPIDPTRASLREWCEAYLGKPALDYLISPFVSGVFACSPEELNAKLAFPKLVPEAHQSLYSHFKRRTPQAKSPRPEMMTPVYGMQSLVDALYVTLKDDIRLNSAITETPDAPNVIYTLPSKEMAKLIRTQDPQSATLLDAVKYSPLISMTVFFESKNFLNGSPRGVGVLIPKNENFNLLGVLFNSSAFHHRIQNSNHVSLTYMFGGTQAPAALKLSDQELVDIVEIESRKLFKTAPSFSTPLHFHISRWDKAVPIYSNSLINLHRSLALGVCSRPGQVLFSNYSGQVSIRGMIESLLLIQ